MFCLDPVIIVVLQDYFPDVEAEHFLPFSVGITVSLQEQFSAEEPRGGSVAAFRWCRNRHHITIDWFIERSASVFTSWFYLSLSGSISAPPTPHPDPLLLPCKMPDEVRLGVHVGSCYLATAVISRDSASTRQPLSPSFGFLLAQQQPFFFFLYDRLLVSTHRGNNFYFFISFVIFGVKSFCLFLKLPSTEPGSLTFHMNLHINITFSSP